MALAATDGLHDFHFVTLLEDVTGMLTTGYDTLIDLDSQSFVFKPQQGNELLQV